MTRKTDGLLAGAIAAGAAALYFATTGSFAYPGESAHLIALWRGLDFAESSPYPLTAFFARLLGGGNLLAPLCGTVAATLVFVLVAAFLRRRVTGEDTERFALPASRLAGVVAAAVFALSPAVRSAATHLEPRMFGFAWMAGAFALAIPWARERRWFAFAYPLAFGAMWGLGAADQPLFWLALPLALAALAWVPLANGRRPYAGVALALASGFVAFSLLLRNSAGGDFGAALSRLWALVRSAAEAEGAGLVFAVSVLPPLVMAVASRRAFSERGGLSSLLFLLGLSVLSVLAVATPLAPGALLEPTGALPVAASAFAATGAGLVVACWWLAARSAGEDARRRALALAVCCAVGFALAFTALFDLFTFDTRRGAFADRLAAEVLDDLGDRRWLVSDGTLDDHLRIVAAARGQPLELVCLSRDLDEKYLSRLAAHVRETGLGGERNLDLSISLSLGVLPFVQDWFRGDPASATNAAVFGSAELWYAGEIAPVPEFAFFGADPSRAADWSRWDALADALEAPDGWGSHGLHRVRNPVSRLRLALRRYLGMVANNRGVWLQEQGRDDEAYDLYDLVLSRIDADNVSALFNAFLLADGGHARAAAKKAEYRRRIDALVADKARRYRLPVISGYYGYIRKAELLVRLGYGWARAGMPGAALGQIRRAIAFAPEAQSTVLMNMMASLYAADENREKSRETFERVLERKVDDHDALIGMMRLALQAGDAAAAEQYLARAVEAAGDDPRADSERASLALMRGELDEAKAILRRVTDVHVTDLGAWSLLASVVMQQCDRAKDPAEKAKLQDELEKDILMRMQQQTKDPNNYQVQTVRGFLLLRKGGEEARRAARDCFAVAANSRPDIGSSQELVLGLDISLDDPVAAEAHAKGVLRRNRRSPLANYIMGALAMRKEDYQSAEGFLRRAVDCDRPLAVAANDLAETLRRTNRFKDAERYARKAIALNPKLYVAYETAAASVAASGGDLKEALELMDRAVSLSTAGGRPADVRMLITQGRLQLQSGDSRLGKATLRKVRPRLSELSEFERREFEALVKDVR